MERAVKSEQAKSAYSSGTCPNGVAFLNCCTVHCAVGLVVTPNETISQAFHNNLNPLYKKKSCTKDFLFSS
ncbi:hypothetical protein [Ureibacillus thermophilus]|uniref:hypothetical protein n=1 Tax=Ureibacillus thermophilus TaxID=367743 RepID=UPI001AC00128|nr:hypothetical protein [Ureibacillus thermophilus]